MNTIRQLLADADGAAISLPPPEDSSDLIRCTGLVVESTGRHVTVLFPRGVSVQWPIDPDYLDRSAEVFALSVSMDAWIDVLYNPAGMAGGTPPLRPLEAVTTCKVPSHDRRAEVWSMVITALLSVGLAAGYLAMYLWLAP